jgi:hypothetical protein
LAGTQNSPISIASSPINFSTEVLSPQHHSTPQSTPQYRPSHLREKLQIDDGNTDEEEDSYLPSFSGFSELRSPQSQLHLHRVLLNAQNGILIQIWQNTG